MAVFRLPFEYPEIQVSLVMDDSISFWILDSGLTRVWGVFRGNDVICGCLWLQEVARKDCSQGEKLCWRTIYSILPDHPPCASKRPARGMSVFWTRQVWKVWITCCSWPNKCIGTQSCQTKPWYVRPFPGHDLREESLQRQQSVVQLVGNQDYE